MEQIIVKPVKTSKELRHFIEFNYKLYKGCKYAVPDLYADMKRTFTQKNAALSFCKCQCFLAYKGNEIVGRVAAIINDRANNAWQSQEVRFGWIDFVDDQAVSKALLQAVEQWGAAQGMTEIKGPLGFTDMDKEGMLYYGFEELGTMATAYNYPYYIAHLEALGYEKDVDWIEYKMNIPSADAPNRGIPERLSRMTEIVKSKYGLQNVHFKSSKALAKAYGKQIFDVINEAYIHLFGYSALDDKQIKQYVNMYLGMIDPKLISLVTESSGRLIGIGICMPSISEALQKSGGKLFPLGWYHLLKALKWKKADHIDMLLVAVLPEYQSKGANALFFSDLIPNFIAGGYKWCESSIILENNKRSLDQWIYFNPTIHKRRRCFKKQIK